MSFFLVRLLQEFETISFDNDAMPPESRPPAEWSGLPGRKGKEKFWPKSHLTLYSAVSASNVQFSMIIDSIVPQGGMWVKMSEANNDAA